MKKIISLTLLLSLVVLCLAACGGGTDPTTPTETTYNLSIGVAVNVDDATATVESTVAAVVTDEDGEIILVRLDAIDYTAEVDKTTGAPKTVLPTSKYELGSNYNMVAYGGAKAEWFEQAKSFEKYVRGMTLSEVRAIALNADGKPTDADLTAGCTIAVTPFIEAIDKAMSSEHKISFTTAETEFTAAVVASPAIDAKADTLTFDYEVDFAAVVAKGNSTLAAIFDSVAVSLTCAQDADGKLSATATTYEGTKFEQGEDYNMVEYGGAASEWYAQALAYANEAKGKNPTALDTLPTEGVAGCTIAVDGYKAALAKAGKALR